MLRDGKRVFIQPRRRVFQAAILLVLARVPVRVPVRVLAPALVIVHVRVQAVIVTSAVWNADVLPLSWYIPKTDTLSLIDKTFIAIREEMYCIE